MLLNPYRFRLPPSKAFTSNQGDGSDGVSTYSFPGTPIGTAAVDRVVAVGIYGRAGSARTITAVTIGGVAATVITQINPLSNDVIAMAYAVVPTGTTATIDVDFSAAMLRCGIGVWAMYDLNSATPTDFASATGDPATTTACDIQAGGVCLGFGSTTQNTTQTWTGLTEDFDAVFDSNGNYSGASDVFATAQTGPTISTNFGAATAPGMVVASWR